MHGSHHNGEEYQEEENHHQRDLCYVCACGYINYVGLCVCCVHVCMFEVCVCIGSLINCWFCVQNKTTDIHVAKTGFNS